MPVPSREQASAVLAEGHRATRELIARLAPDQLERPSTMGGGDWSAKDLVGHLANWEELSLRALEEWRRGERPHVEGLFASDEAVDRENAEAIRRKAGLSAARVLREADETHRTLAAAIEAVSDEEWTAKASYATERRRTLGALLGSITGAPQRPFGHGFAHPPDLEAYVSSLR